MRDLSSLAIRDFNKILETNKTPTLFISDVQESSVRVLRDKSFITYICKMVQLFRENNFLIIITEFGASLGSTIIDILSLVLDYNNLVRIQKNKPSAFDLIKRELETQSISAVMIVGMEACYCCLVNARILINDKYTVFISLNGIEDSNPQFSNMNKCLRDYKEINVKILE